MAALRRAGRVTSGRTRIAADIAHFKAALAAANVEEGFMTSVGPASVARVANEFYKSEEEFIWACADAMREEYQAIIDAGLVLQIDDPFVAEAWDQINPEPTVEDYQRFTMVAVEALNHALREGFRPSASASTCAGAAGMVRTRPTSRCATSST